MTKISNRSLSPNRLEAFSDGVFSIAITLLVLELHIPRVQDGELAESLLSDWPSYLSYIVSFFSIGITWVNHHGLFDRIKATSRTLLFLNLGLLLGVATIPFTTSLASAWLQTPSGSTLAVAIYCLNWALIALMFIAILRYLLNNSELYEAEFSRIFKEEAKRGKVGISLYILASLITLISPILAICMCLIMCIWFVFVPQ